MKAIWNNTVIAETSKDKLIHIESNWYFPSNTINKEYFQPSDKHTNCHWKGQASYYNIDINGNVSQDGAWYYPQPMDGSIEKVGKDFTDYVAFGGDVEIEE
ncbi:MAG: DUF427 domain-containing protein [Candidatus Saccharimonadales bacterium]